MPLRIIPSTDPLTIENIVLTEYAAPGLGKTSLAFTADNPICFDADKGAYRATNRKDTVPVQSWSDLEYLTAEDLAPYSTVILDTGGRILDKLRVQLIRDDPKNAGSYGGMSGKGWNNMFSGFSGLVNKVLAARKDLIIVCHMDEKQQGEDTLERIDVAGQSKNEIYKLSDAMCRIFIDSKGNRFLNFDPREGGFGKNPAQLPHVPFPHPEKQPDTMAKVIAQIKASINRMTAEQASARKEQEEWVKAMAECDTLDCFNRDMVKLAKERKGGFGAFVKAEAKRRGYEFDKASGLYVQSQMAEAVA